LSIEEKKEKELNEKKEKEPIKFSIYAPTEEKMKNPDELGLAENQEVQILKVHFPSNDMLETNENF
jgi:hypothetical protein